MKPDTKQFTARIDSRVMRFIEKQTKGGKSKNEILNTLLMMGLNVAIKKKASATNTDRS